MGEDLKSGLPILMIAMDLAGSSCVFLTVDMEGLMRIQAEKEIRSDWRYDISKRKWYDASFQGEDDA